MIHNIPVFYINLDDNIERNKNIIENINKVGFTNYEKISAVDTRTIEKVNKYKNMIDSNSYKDLLENNKSHKRKYHEDLTNGSIGCFLSHLKIYQKIVDNNIPMAIILEDDCVFNLDKEKFWNQINKINMPQDTDMIILSGIFKKFSKINENVGKFKRFYLLHFYVVTNSGAKKLLENLKIIQYQIDSQISILNLQKKINLYAYNDISLAHSDSKFGTNIQNLSCYGCSERDLDNLDNLYNINYIIIIIIFIFVTFILYYCKIL